MESKDYALIEDLFSDMEQIIFGMLKELLGLLPYIIFKEIRESSHEDLEEKVRDTLKFISKELEFLIPWSFPIGTTITSLVTDDATVGERRTTVESNRNVSTEIKRIQNSKIGEPDRRVCYMKIQAEQQDKHLDGFSGVEITTHSYAMITTFFGEISSHINPALKFAKRLANSGARVTFLLAVSAHRRISNNTSTNLINTSSPITFLPFSDGYDDGIKSGNNGKNFMSKFKNRATEALTDLIRTSEEESCPVTCFVYTFLLPWAAEVSADLSIVDLDVPFNLAFSFAATMNTYANLGVERNINLVYGGGNVRLMGLVSQAVYDWGHHVLGYLIKQLIPFSPPTFLS
ncbi:hypothetical protein Syun_006178 [Stephania yunnanensis]|uniref:Uncharacterized protein n=1 Tax=Stephania yunnanensis TaxID=152371 RepID=A0AAP0KW39_9MAGN